jgi:WD40 repeat protein
VFVRTPQSLIQSARWLTGLLLCVALPGLAAAAEPPTEPLLRIEAEMHTANLRRIATDAASRYLVTGSYDKTTRIWDISTGREVMQLSGHSDRLRAVAFSPDGRFIAATKTDSFGTDVAILDGSGKEVLRVTNDHHSFSPVWSPAGDAVAYLHLAGTIVDLKLAQLDSATGNWAVTKTIDLTKVSGLDGASRPSWFTPASDLPAPSAVPGSSGSAAPPPSSSASSAP